MKNKKRFIFMVIMIIVLIVIGIFIYQKKSDDKNKMTDYERYEKIKKFESQYDGSNDSEPLTQNESGFIVTITNRKVLEKNLDLDTVLIIQDKLLSNLQYFNDIKKFQDSSRAYSMCKDELVALYSIKSEDEFNDVYGRIKKVQNYELVIDEDTLKHDSNIVTFSFKLGGQPFSAKFIINLDIQNRGSVFYLS